MSSRASIASGSEPDPVSSVSSPGRPPRDRLARAILVVTIIGLLDAAYLTYVHYKGFQALACFGGSAKHPSSCQTVQSSVWSRIDGVPVALLGLIGYVMLLGSLPLAARRDTGELGRAAGFGVALIGFCFSAYLTYREAFSIHSYCEWCLGSAVCLTILTVLTGIRFLRGAPAVLEPEA
jgi:uncharacterized membrane protein